MPVKTTLNPPPRFDDDDDPLTRAIAPPPNETDAQRAERLRAEAEAKRVSDMIDDELNKQRLTEKKGQRPVKILLLGQSESGKSTLLKNFQLINSPKAFKAERISWRAVIQLNIVRSFRIILDAILEAHSTQLRNGGGGGSGSSSSVDPTTTATMLSPRHDHPPVTHEHLQLRVRLLPLLHVEQRLVQKLTPPGTSREIEATLPTPTHPTPLPTNPNSPSSPLHSQSTYRQNGGASSIPTSSTSTSTSTSTPPLILSSRTKEVSVSASFAWKEAFSRIIPGGIKRSSGDSSNANAGIDWDDPNDPTRVLNALGEDMLRLWHDPTIRLLLKARKLRLEEMPGFFLDSLERITTLDYIPTDDDVLRARLKTLGVTEYRFTVKVGNAVGHDWRIYDVGGQRSLRAAWVPFFDDMDAIIFLAPISCFDQVLAEDNTVNRLEDSVLLWRSIVSNHLLSKTNMILFLNKCDVLQRKLVSGIRFGKYVISYAERPNDFENVAEYLRKKFAGLHKDHSPETRPFYCHFTNVTDTTTTALILENVTDTVLSSYLRKMSVI